MILPKTRKFAAMKGVGAIIVPTNLRGVKEDPKIKKTNVSLYFEGGE